MPAPDRPSTGSSPPGVRLDGGDAETVAGVEQGVPVADVRILHPVQQHVHAADAQHGGVEVVAVEGALVEPAGARAFL